MEIDENKSAPSTSGPFFPINSLLTTLTSLHAIFFFHFLELYQRSSAYSTYDQLALTNLGHTYMQLFKDSQRPC